MNVERRSPDQPFRRDGNRTGFTVGQFWQWAMSDVTGNTERAIVAEFIVANALKVADGVRNPWQSFDLRTGDGIRVEVKSAAYLQAWHQDKPSDIRFSIAPSMAWNPETGKFESVSKRQSDIYVFCVFENLEQREADPMELSNWTFYVISTALLNEKCANQKSIGLKSLLGLSPARCKYGDLPDEVRRVSAESAG